MVRDLDLDELVEHFTLYPDELELLRNKSGATRLGFAVSMKFLLWKARFPSGRSELPDSAIEFVAKQVGVPACDIGLYELGARQAKRHRTEIRGATGFRQCSASDAQDLTAWLAQGAAGAERRADRLREVLLGRCRDQRIEPPHQIRSPASSAQLPTAPRPSSAPRSQLASKLPRSHGCWT